MKKKIVVIFWIISIMMVFFNINISSATDNATTTLVAKETEITKGSTEEITIKLANITGSEEGINSFMGTLIYDTTIFETVTFTALNSWDTPTYNEENGQILTTKGSFVKNSEDMFTISLKVKSDAELGETKIQIKDVTIADTENEYTASNGEVTVKVVEKQVASNDNATDNSDNSNTENKDNTNSDNSNTENKDNTNSDNSNTENKDNTNNSISNTTNNSNNNNSNSSTTNNSNNNNSNTTNTNISKNNTVTLKNTIATNNDNTLAQSKMPNTGVVGGSIVVIGVIILGLGIVSFIKYNEYKSIK